MSPSSLPSLLQLSMSCPMPFLGALPQRATSPSALLTLASRGAQVKELSMQGQEES